MTAKTQGISLMGILTGIATFAGILANVPQLIRDNIASVPSFFKNPDVIWAISIFFVYVLCVLFLLLRGRKTGSWSLIAGNRIGAVLANLADFSRKHDVDWDPLTLAMQDITADQAESIICYCTKELPNAIQATLGDKERDLLLKRFGFIGLVRDESNEEAKVYALVVWNWLTKYVEREATEALRRDAAAIRPS